MRTLRVILETVNALALGVWAGMLVFVGVAAALTFPLMKRLDPTLAGFERFEGEHWRLAAGAVMDPLFFAVFTSGATVFVLACLLLGGVFAINQSRGVKEKLFGKRAVFLSNLGIAHLLCGTLLWGPMNGLFGEQRLHAASGDMEAWRGVSERFEALHQWAGPAMGVLLLMTLVYLVFSLVCAFRAMEER